MKQLVDFKKEIHKCSKCGLCQAECPIYKITGNDCSVSRGQFIMLKGFLKKVFPKAYADGIEAVALQPVVVNSCLI